MKKHILIFSLLTSIISYTFWWITTYDAVSNSVSTTIYWSNWCTMNVIPTSIGYSMYESCIPSVSDLPKMRMIESRPTNSYPEIKQETTSKTETISIPKDCHFPTDFIYKSCLDFVWEDGKKKCLSNIDTALSVINNLITNLGDNINLINCKYQLKEDEQYLTKMLSIMNWDFLKSISSKNSQDNREIEIAIKRMYKNWLTNYNNISDYMGNDYLTREQASKIFVKFANLFWKFNDLAKTNIFSDIKNSDKSLLPYINQAYGMSIINWKNNKFMPFNKLTQAQAIAIAVRITDWQLNENNDKRYYEYYNLVDINGILDWLWFDYNNIDSIYITRKDVALLLYRIYQTIKKN